MPTTSPLHGFYKVLHARGDPRSPSRLAYPFIVNPASTTSLAATVYHYLVTNYPAHDLSWVSHAAWSLTSVPLDAIKLPRDQQHDVLRLDTETQALLDYTNSGRPVDPIVLIRTRKGFTVVDGHHRLRVYNILHKPQIAAYVGVLPNFADPWTATSTHAASPSSAADQAMTAELTSLDLDPNDDVKYESECERKFSIDPSQLPESILSQTPWAFVQAYWPSTYHLQPSLRLIPATDPPFALFRLKTDAAAECRQKYATHVTYESAVPAFLNAPTAAYKERYLYRDAANNAAVWRIDWFPMTDTWKGEIEVPNGTLLTVPDWATDELTNNPGSYTGAFAAENDPTERKHLLTLAQRRGTHNAYHPDSFQNQE